MIDFTFEFPPGFLWGTATAAHQVEGDNTNNNWHAWEQAGRIYQGQRAGAACEWWQGRYAEDFDRAAGLHNNAHRFSMEWSRVEPEPGQYDEAALAHYVTMVEALRARGLEPVVTLHHFTTPLWLEELGGWAHPESVWRFEAFVKRVVEAVGPRVRLWCTINEPMVYATQGYLFGYFPPGKRSLGQALRVATHMLRGHAAAYYAIKDLLPDAEVGFAKHQIALQPRQPVALHLPARNTIRYVFNRAFVDALVTGVFRTPFGKTEVSVARGALDWIGLNYYYRFKAGFSPFKPGQTFLSQSRPRSGILGPESVGEIWPEGLFDEIKWLAGRVGKPVYVTENGVPDPDDAIRPLHMVRSLRNLWDAVNFNFLVKGYFHWTLVDNFEWMEGYDPRFNFGLFALDRATQARTPRPSADLYRAVCEANGLTATAAREFIPDEFDALFPGIDVQDEVVLPPRDDARDDLG